ncbi:MAG: energy transducer TonB [Bacteroidetes bacterium]|nr:energy transducer TonB [Bacteroidota bacterium]
MKYIIIALLVSLQTLNCYAQQDDAPKERFKYVEQMPQPDFDIVEYLSSNVHYPDTARNNNIQGRVLVQFVVTDKGTITDVKAINNPRLGYGLEEEAIRVIKAMPNWKPGKQNGKAVDVYYTQPIRFKFDDEKPVPEKK